MKTTNVACRAALRRREVGRGVRLCLCILATVMASLGGCSRSSALDAGIRSAIQGHEFNLLQWEIRHGLEGTKAPTSNGMPLSAEEERVLVERFFDLGWELGALRPGSVVKTTDGRLMSDEEVDAVRTAVAGEREELREAVQWILGRQVRQIYNEQGIYNPLDRYLQVRVPFPPINFRLARPPQILVVSPRDRIESIREIMLAENVDIHTAGELEMRVDALGVSSLVIEIGGLGATYPTFVADDATMAWTIQTVAEEWLHQYLFFTPLGFLYALDGLGLRRDYEIATMNETVAGIVSSEIANQVLERFYGIAPPSDTPAEGDIPAEPAPSDRFDFVMEMRRTRLRVDELLAAGKISEAEEYMEARRKEFVAEGYAIRKLNQAYFAFYGTYGDAPTSVSPIGAEMRVLREQVLRERAGSLAAFLNRVVSMTSRQDLENATQ